MLDASLPAATRAKPTSSPWWVAALTLVVAEALLASVGGQSLALATIALFAPGLSLVPLLPAAMRTTPLAALAAAPTLGLAASAIAITTVSKLGIDLTGTSIRITLLVLVAVSAAAWLHPHAAVTHVRRTDAREAALLGLITAVGFALAFAVVGSRPVPGNDWAKYLLYADEIRRHGSLLIDNPFWMLGVPFREDPAAGALYGGAALLSGAPTGALAQGILVFAVGNVLAVFAAVRGAFGPGPALLAAALVAVVPASLTILGWHGLANLAALALLSLALGYLAALTRERLDAHAVVGLAVVMVGLLAAHRLTTVIAGLVIVTTIAALLLTPRRNAVIDIAAAGAGAVILGAGVLADIWARQQTFGGTQGAEAYRNTTIDVLFAVKELSWVLTFAAVIGLAALIARKRVDRALWPWLAATVVCIGLGYSYVINLPMYYERMIFYLPIALAPIAAVAWWTLVPARWRVWPAVVGVVIVAAISVPRAEQVRTFYAFATPASLRGLDALALRLRPGEVVVTDRCWSFQAAWLLRRPVLAALETQDIQPLAELRRARQAKAILRGTPEGARLARRLGIRYAVVDPTCRLADGKVPQPVAGTRFEYQGRRLTIERLPFVTRAEARSAGSVAAGLAAPRNTTRSPARTPRSATTR